MNTREVQVLLVEDSPEERRLVRLELSEIDEPFFRTHEASRLSEAEAHLRKGQTDVVLLDLSLPDSGGLEGLIHLCKQFPTLPVVVFTGLDDERIALQALREGGQDFLVKGQTEPIMLKRVLLHAIERKRVDVALNNSRESLREAQRLETLGRLAGKIAHDFNNILTTIVGFSDLLLEDLQGHSAIEDIMEIKKAGERGAALTSSILSFSRREQPMLDALYLNEAIMGVAAMLKQLLPKGVTLEIDLTPGLPEALADLGQVEQALVNLVANARDAMPAGGVVRITSEMRRVTTEGVLTSPLPRPGEYLAITVNDNGQGMDPSTLDRVFEPFFTTKPRGSGTGLGLSTVISIMRGCGGGVEVRSGLDKGSSFILYFPVYGAQAEDRMTGPGPIGPESVPAAVPLDLPSLGGELGASTAFGLNGRNGHEEASSEFTMTRAEMSEHLRHLYHVVSHDFHEPLRMVNSYLGLVKRRGKDSLEDELLEFINYAVDGSQRMQAMLDGVLRYSRCLKSPPTEQPTAVAELFERIVAEMPHGTVLDWQGERPVLRASEDHVAMLFRELISNAVKFGDPCDPKVRIECRRDEESWRFEVVDNGPGSPEGASEKCFQLFGRVHGREEYPGLGVGLTVAECLAEKYGARISLGSLAGGGGKAVLVWPIAAAGAQSS